ncbi:MAG: hypothetical protein SNH94_07495 [Rikenellaceae bacterium]
MKKLSKSLLILFSLCATLACSNNDNAIYISTSGEGSLVVNSDSADYLYRMVLLASENEQNIYLMGYTAYVDTDAEFEGRGAVIKITIPTTEQLTSIEAQSFTVGISDYTVSYSSYINYSSQSNDDLTALESGTVIIRNSGLLYDIRILGEDSDENNIIAAYRGYIYRTLLN